MYLNYFIFVIALLILIYVSSVVKNKGVVYFLGIILIYSCSSYRGRETKELIPRDGHDACSNKDQSWTAEDPRLGLSKTFRRPRRSEYQWKMSEKWSKGWVTIQCSFKSKA